MKRDRDGTPALALHVIRFEIRAGAGFINPHVARLARRDVSVYLDACRHLTAVDRDIAAHDHNGGQIGVIQYLDWAISGLDRDGTGIPAAVIHRHDHRNFSVRVLITIEAQQLNASSVGVE